MYIGLLAFLVVSWPVMMRTPERLRFTVFTVVSAARDGLTSRCSCRAAGSWPRAFARDIISEGPLAAEPQALGLNASVALESVWELGMPTTSTVVHSDPEILGGTPVFVGTRRAAR